MMRCIIRTRTDKGAMYVRDARPGKDRVHFTPNIQEAQVFLDLATAKRWRDTCLMPWRKVDILRVEGLKNLTRKMEITKNVHTGEK